MSLLNGTQYIKPVKEHYEAYTDKGEFICSGDTFQECSDELLEMIKVEVNQMLQPVSA